MTVFRAVLAAAGAVAAVSVVAAAVVAYLTFGTAPSAAPGTRSETASIVARSAASPAAPAAFRNRAAFPSCGAVALERDGTIAAARIACLVGAPASGRELVVVSRSSEGDPVVRYYRTGPMLTGVEIFEDGTADRFDGEWHRTLCRSGRIDQIGACA